MEYKRFNDTIILRLDPGEEICERLTALASEEGIDLAEISGLGAVDTFTAGIFDTVNKVFIPRQYTGAFEIASLTGTLTRQDGKPYLHVHMSAGDVDGTVRGGHLSRARVSATAEIVVRIVQGNVGRKFSDAIGLNLLDF